MWRKAFLRFFLVLAFLITNINIAYSYSSVAEFEANNNPSTYTMNNCSGMAIPITQLNVLNNTYIPPILGPNAQVSPNTKGYAATASASTVLQWVASVLYGGLAAEYIMMSDLCTNANIVTPAEYVNRNVYTDGAHWSCDGNGQNIAPNKFTDSDIPFYFSCDPNYDPLSGQSVTGTSFSSSPSAMGAYGVNNASDVQSLVGRVWGYMGAASSYCVHNQLEINQSRAGIAQKELVGVVYVDYHNGFTRAFAGYTRCATPYLCQGGGCTDSFYSTPFRAGDNKYIGAGSSVAYYQYNSSLGKIQICVAAMLLNNIQIGCSYIAPPAEDTVMDPFFTTFVQNTRCSYFVSGRTDLQSLGSALAVSAGTSGYPVTQFLNSDLHMTSTVVGCIKDMLITVLMSNSNLATAGQGFFVVLQNRLSQIVYAVLTLYVCLIGIKIMSAPQVPSRGEFMMYILKFGLVVYFTTPAPWYSVSGGQIYGLFPTLIWAADSIANWFLTAQNVNDLMGLCSYQHLGSELLSQRDIVPPAGAVPTAGSTMIEMTIWDLVDCKIVNYLNFGSCQYDLSGMLGMWMIGAAALVTGQGFLLAVALFVFAFMFMLIIFRFTHIFILSAFIIAVLVLLSPIFLCFALFEPTKGIFDTWMKYILGYILYPALLFAFVSLMLATFDAIFYGDLAQKATNGQIPSGQSLQTLCQGVTNSIYCATATQGTVVGGASSSTTSVQGDPCGISTGGINAALTTQLNLGILGNFTVLKSVVVATYLPIVLQLMLFALLFYLFLGGVTEFLSTLVAIQDIGNRAQGSINITAPFKAVGGMAADGISALAGKAAGSVSNAASKGKRDGK